MKKIVVVGGGTMGLDVAQCFARAGFETFVRSTSQNSIDRHSAKLMSTLEKQVSRGRMDAETAAAIQKNLQFTLELDVCRDAFLVLEAAPENPDIKKDLFQQLEQVCTPEVILASNTSTIPITKIASFVKTPQRVIGMHFFNPATVMKLVEVIRAEQTSQETFEAVRDTAIAISKEPVEIQDAPGFVVNRILIPMINEAVDLYQAGVASAADIDRAMTLGANHPIGPLALGDLVGLDVCLAIMDTLFAETHDSKYRASATLRKMVNAGKLGRKTGCGFFSYTK